MLFTWSIDWLTLILFVLAMLFTISIDELILILFVLDMLFTISIDWLTPILLVLEISFVKSIDELTPILFVLDISLTPKSIGWLTITLLPFSIDLNIVLASLSTILLLWLKLSPIAILAFTSTSLIGPIIKFGRSGISKLKFCISPTIKLA